jgi:hypothetical protein
MSTLVIRQDKGSPLTNVEVDSNFTSLLESIGGNGTTPYTLPTPTGTGVPVLSNSPTLTGTILADNATLSGNINGVNATLSGNISAANATLSGNINGVNATLSGDISADNLVLSGNLSVSGTTTTVNATSVTITDPLIYIAADSTTNINDLGIVASYDDGTYQHTGLVRDASDGTWKLFSGVSDEPTGIINFTQATYSDLKLGRLISTTATGTSPFIVTSTTKVDNLNTDLLDGQSSDYYGTASAVALNTVKQTNVTTNLTTSYSSTTVTVNSSDGTNATINAATTTLSGILSKTDKLKLNAIEYGATADQTGSQILALLSNSITSDHIAPEGVGASEIGNNVVNSQHYVAGSIDNEHIADNAINSEHYANDSIDALHLNVLGNGTTAEYLRSDGDGTMSWVAPPDTWRSISDSVSSTSSSISASSSAVRTAHNNNTTYTSGNGLTLSGTQFLMSGSYTGNFTASGNVTAFSDKRLKSNIYTIENSLDKVKQMRGVNFEMYGKHGTGVIAQEIEKVLPEVVFNNEEYKSVAYGNIVGILIEAIKELSDKVTLLENK